MEGPARIEITFYLGDLIVHEYRRSSTMLQEKSLPKMMQDAAGWLGAYAVQVSNRQFLADAKRIKEYGPL